MNSMNDLDLNLLREFDSVWRDGHLGLASKELELSQHAVRRLREGVRDPLLVKVASRMQPPAGVASIVQSILASVRKQVLAATRITLRAARQPCCAAIDFQDPRAGSDANTA